MVPDGGILKMKRGMVSSLLLATGGVIGGAIKLDWLSVHIFK